MSGLLRGLIKVQGREETKRLVGSCSLTVKSGLQEFWENEAEKVRKAERKKEDDLKSGDWTSESNPAVCSVCFASAFDDWSKMKQR